MEYSVWSRCTSIRTPLGEGSPESLRGAHEAVVLDHQGADVDLRALEPLREAEVVLLVGPAGPLALADELHTSIISIPQFYVPRGQKIVLHSISDTF